MLQRTRKIGTRFLGTGGALALAAGGLVLTAPVQAQTAAQAPQAQTVKVLRMSTDGSRSDGAPEVRIQSCEGERIEVNAGEGRGTGHNARIVLCGKEGASNAELADMFERAVTTLEAQDGLRSDRKAELLAQLRARIAELRSR